MMAVELMDIACAELTNELLSGIGTLAHLILIDALRVLIEPESCRSQIACIGLISRP